MTEKTHHVADKKKQIAKNIQKLILDYPIIAAVDMENLPTPQLQQMRAQLRGKIELTMTKRRIIKHAIDGVKDKKKNIEQLDPHLKGMPALIFTKENPFSLFKTLKKSKTSAPAKAGQTSPFDIIVPKGPTSFAPGPVIGELAQLGIKSGVEGGKVAIKEDSIVVKEGEKISAKAAEILTRLGIEPMEVGLNVTAVYENGEIFTRDILDIDEEKFMSDLQAAASGSFNLAVNIEYPTKETINVLIGKAFNDAKALGLSQNIIDEGVIDALLSKAESSALSLKSTAKIETVEKPKEEATKSEEKPKAEEKKEEPKAKEVPAPKAEEEKPKEEPTATEKKEEKVLEEEKKVVEEEKKLEKEAEKPKIEAPVEKEVEEEVKEEEEKQLEKERIEKEKELEKIEEQKKAEEAKKKEEGRRKQEEEKKKQEEARRKEEEQRKKQEEERKRAEEEAKKKEEGRRKQEEAKREEKKRRLEEEQRKKQEEKRKAEEEAKKQKPQDETDKRIAEMVAKTKKFVKGDIPDAGKLVEEAGKLAEEEVKKEVPKEKEQPKVEEKPKEAPKVQEKIPSIQELKEKKKEKDIEKKKKEQKEVEDLAQELIKKGTLRK